MKTKSEEVEEVLREFWIGESPNGAYHACEIATNANKHQIDFAHHVMTVEEARDKILAIFDTEKGKG